MLDEGTTKIELIGEEIEFKNELSLADLYAIGMPPIDFEKGTLVGDKMELIHFYEKCLVKLSVKNIKWNKVKPSVMFKFMENKQLLGLIMNTFKFSELDVKTDDLEIQSNQKKN